MHTCAAHAARPDCSSQASKPRRSCSASRCQRTLRVQREHGRRLHRDGLEAKALKHDLQQARPVRMRVERGVRHKEPARRGVHLQRSAFCSRKAEPSRRWTNRCDGQCASGGSTRAAARAIEIGRAGGASLRTFEPGHLHQSSMRRTAPIRQRASRLDTMRGCLTGMRQDSARQSSMLAWCMHLQWSWSD